jgi:hypothetical protein
MTEYTVTMRLNDREQFVHFIDTVGPVVDRLVVTVKADEVPADNIAPAPSTVRAPSARATRVPRGSKVNTTILQALMEGPKAVKDLKEALERANLSSGSLSTGLAVLQRSKQVHRVQDGVYGLAGAPVQQAA